MKTTILLFFVLSASHLYAQQTISTSGASFHNESETLDWSVGEIITETMVTDNSVLTHGLLQTRLEVSTLIKSTELAEIIRAYPNPAHDFIFLHMTTEDLKGMRYALFNATSNLLQQGAIREEISKISFIPLPPGTYFIRITKGEQFIRTFKIIKTN